MPSAKKWTLDAATVVITAFAIVLGGMRIWEIFLKPDPNAPRQIADWQRYGIEGQRTGSPAAAVTIVEFADFQCPYCRQAAEDLKAVLEKFPEHVALVYRHYPLRIHDHAIDAARAAECAAAEGAFWVYHDLLFAQADSIGKKPWEQFAEEAGIRDIPGFHQCVTDTGPIPAVRRDTVAGNDLGLVGTPLFLINDLRVPLYPGEEMLKEYIDDALRRSRESQ